MRIAEPPTTDEIRASVAKLRAEIERTIQRREASAHAAAVRIARELVKAYPAGDNVAEGRRDFDNAASAVPYQRALLAALADAEAQEIADTRPLRASWEAQKAAEDAARRQADTAELSAVIYRASAVPIDQAWSRLGRDGRRVLEIAAQNTLIDSGLREHAGRLLAEIKAAVPMLFYDQERPT